MSHLQYLPGDPRLVDQLVYELKSKGIFDQFRKECIADVDTRPAYQNLRQRVESSVAAFLARQCWKPDLNKNQLREKLRKHLLDGNYLEQGVERIVDQVVNPKVASVFIPQVEDVVYNFLGIPRKKSVCAAETSNGKVSANNDLLPTDLEAVSPGSVKSNDDKTESMDTTETQDDDKMEVDEEKPKEDIREDSASVEIVETEKVEGQDSRLSGISELTYHDSDISIDKNTTTIPLPAEEIKLENIPAPDNSPPNIKNKNIDLEKINLPKEPNLSTDIPLPDELPKVEKETFFKPMTLQSEDDDTSSDSSLRRNMSPLTPIRNFNNENSCDAQQGFDNDSDGKSDGKKEPSSFRFTIESKSSENSSDVVKTEKKDPEQALSHQFNTQVNINTYNTPLYEDSSNSNNLQIDYESDANSKATVDAKQPEADQNSGDSKKERKLEEKKSSHKSSHRSRDSHRHSSSKDKKSDSKHSSRDSSRHDKKSSKDESKSKSSTHKERSSDRGDKKDGRESSKHRSSHKSSSSKDSKHKSSSSSKHSSKHDEKKSSSTSHKDKEKERTSDKSKDRSKDSKSSSHRSDKSKDRKSSSKSKHDEKENKEKKDKKETDDHYSLSGRGNPNRRSTDRDSNDGSSSSKGSHNPSNTKTSESKKDKKGTSKSDNTSNSGDSTSPSDKDVIVQESKEAKHNVQTNRAVRVETHLKKPIATPPRLPFVPDVTLKKPRFAANLEEAKRMMKMRKFLEEEQKRMNQEAALLLEFQANVRPSLSQVYSSIPGPELEFACISNTTQPTNTQVMNLEENSVVNETTSQMAELPKVNEIHDETIQNETTEISETNVIEKTAQKENVKTPKDSIDDTLNAMHMETNVDQTQEENLERTNSIITENKATNDNTVTIKQTDNEIIQTLTDNNEDEYNHIVILQDPVTESKSDENSKDLPLITKDIQSEDDKKRTEYYEVTIITEEISEGEETQDLVVKKDVEFEHPEEKPLQYFAEHEKYSAELEADRFGAFFKKFTGKIASNKMYLINCDSYEENLIKEASENYGQFDIINYHKNGHLKLPNTTKNIVKNVNVTTEIVLPVKPGEDFEKSVNYTNSVVFSPVKSECSFELSSDYDAKLEEMVNNTSRKQIMEIILGNVADESPNKMPTIDYCMDSSIESEVECALKRKLPEVESSMNNNRHILTPNKIRKLSGSDQISSTTEETEEAPNNNKTQNNTRSKYLGKARRVGLPRPKKTSLPSSPSSDKSVENYSHNARVTRTPNGRSKPRKVQRYDTADLYKPKLHYLSRRNNIS